MVKGKENENVHRKHTFFDISVSCETAKNKEVGEKMVFEAKNPENGAKDMLMEKVEDEHGAA